MCFQQPDPPPTPGPDPAEEAQKYGQFVDNSNKIAKEKDAELGRQRGQVYGLFGQRSLLGADGGGLLRPAGK